MELGRKIMIWTLVGVSVGLVWTVKDVGKFMLSPLYVAKNELEAKVDSLQYEKNYWVTLKDLSAPIDLANKDLSVPTDLADNFIEDCHEQIKSFETSISTIKENPEYKRLRMKAYVGLNGLKFAGGSNLLGLIGLTYLGVRDKRKKKKG